MSAGGGPPGSAPPSAGPTVHRESRWIGQGYADMTKLRERAAKFDRESSRFQKRAASLNTKIEKLRHAAAVLREKGQTVLGKIPDLESEIGQLERNVRAPHDRLGGISLGSDVTDLQVRIRKLQQKVVNLQHKSRTYEHRASMKTQKTAELKVKVDQALERSKLAEQEAQSFRSRADRLQLATQGEAAERLSGTPSAEPMPPPPPPGPGGLS
jgi:chromosome segregation ATPase